MDGNAKVSFASAGVRSEMELTIEAFLKNGEPKISVKTIAMKDKNPRPMN